ncbi:LCP family protein [Sedimentibacter sp. zth1]|uniref:LCP family protein n=1 Tax=Sedimentibacter sp. zth1 TaxID=2816908 RepID=UPI001A92F3F1|nr:LCP family protein [Sedimentibacter sp. zth1]QSX05320.1 LCP family protein [Sedimentibacter sp. zth1]
MRRFFKVYFSTMVLYVCIAVIFIVGFLIVNRDIIVFPTFKQVVDNFTEEDNNNLSALEKAMKKSSIMNILVVGKENVRTDTIMVVSYDKKLKKANVLSVPRDTYYVREGYDNRQQKKINAIYQDEGIVGLKSAVESITKLPIQKYVSVDYNAVIKVVDILEGIEVDVPFNMVYTDPMDTPPLEINISQGLQVLDGENALKFLRFRQNTDGTGYPNGDIGRIKTQQEFIKTAIRKTLSFKLPAVINESFKYIDTDFTLTEILTLATGLGGFKTDSLQTNIIDYYTKTMDGLSYVVPNEDGINNYLYTLYGVQEEDNTGFIQIINDTDSNSDIEVNNGNGQNN